MALYDQEAGFSVRSRWSKTLLKLRELTLAKTKLQESNMAAIPNSIASSPEFAFTPRQTRNWTQRGILTRRKAEFEQRYGMTTVYWRQKTAKRSTHKAPTSRPTDK